MKKSIVYLIITLITVRFSYAQTCYEVEWKGNSGEQSYTALYMVHNGDSFMRVSWVKEGNRSIAKYIIKSTSANSGIYRYKLEGFNAETIYGEGRNINIAQYNADNFIFTASGLSGNEYSAETYDDAELRKSEEEGRGVNTVLAKFKKVNPKNFTKSYIDKFFVEGEPIYNEILGLNTSNDISVIRLTDRNYSNEKRYGVSSIDFLVNKWVVVHEANASKQVWKKSYDFPSYWVESMYKKDFHIRDAAYGNGYWVVLMEESISNADKSQKYILNDVALPEEWISKMGNDGYTIVDAVTSFNQWLVIAEKKRKGLSHIYYSTKGFDGEKMYKYLQEGYYIAHIYRQDLIGEYFISIEKTKYSNLSKRGYFICKTIAELKGKINSADDNTYYVLSNIFMIGDEYCVGYIPSAWPYKSRPILVSSSYTFPEVKIRRYWQVEPTYEE